MHSAPDFERYRPFLEEKTVAEAMQFRSPVVAFTKLTGELLVRHLLYSFFHLEKEDFTIQRGIHGKPYLENRENICFNISHSGDYIVCALSDTPVGIDIEREMVARMNVAHRFFHPLEVESLEKLSGRAQDRLFFKYWSVKESFLKYTGSGLTRPLSSFRVDFADSDIVLYEDAEKVPVYIRECPIDPAYSCFVCTDCDEVPPVAALTTEQLLKERK